MKKINFKLIIKISIILLLTTLVITSSSCKSNRTYHNRKSRYKIKYPAGWIAINSGHDKNAEDKLKQKIKEKSPIQNYNNVDVAFYNPDSEFPILDQITIKSQEVRFNLNNLEASIPQLEILLSKQLMEKFNKVRIVSANIEDFKKGKILHFEFFFFYNNKEYYSVYVIIPGKLFATYYLTGIAKSNNRLKFLDTFNNVLNTFVKY